MKHANISIFVPHLGCPNDCSFCNQRHITGTCHEPDAADIEKAVSIAASSKNFSPEKTEIAFFGGSFTAISRDYMLMLLKTADKEVKTYGLKGIRISTRPDCISDEILNILKNHSVTAIELGAQSLDDTVLLKNERGHTAEDVITASKLIKNHGFELGLQMMTGLYGDSDEKAVKTAEMIVSLSPDTVRIYPTIVLKNTRLHKFYSSGEYTPQTIAEAVALCVKLQDVFRNASIKIIRTGLHSIDESAFVAGPWHPAFSEICDSARFLEQIKKECDEGHSYEIFVNPSDISKAVGQKRQNVLELLNIGINVKFITSQDINKNTMKIREVNQG